MINKPLKWHGGKHYLAPLLVELFPKHLHYVEPFFGGGSVLFQKDPGNCSEVINDIHGELMAFWRVVQSPTRVEQMKEVLSVIPFGKPSFEDALDGGTFGDPGDSELQRALRLFIRYRQSRGGMGKDFATLSRRRTRAGMNEQVSSWLGAIDGLSQAALRLRRVVIFSEPANAIIRQQDGDDTFFYLDPPYLKSTRTAKTVYDFEMSEEHHRELLEVVLSCEGKVMISAYQSELYDDLLCDWNYHDIAIDNKQSAKASKPKMIERVYMNYAPEKWLKA